MSHVWSFNTTVRNPERMQNFLRTLNEFEGRLFDENCQKDFFALQIKKRLYKPSTKTLNEPELIEEINKKTAEEIPDEIVTRIISLYDKNADASLRGRTTAGILNRFGLAIAREAAGQVVITDLGKKWINNEINDQELFFRFLLKWQYPNPIEQGYAGFDVKPFIATMHLIKAVNDKWQSLGENPVGLSKREYLLFVPSLTNYREIPLYTNRIIEYRRTLKSFTGIDKTSYENKYLTERILEIFGKDVDLKKCSGDLRDYTDSSIRYFRMTNFIYERGNNTHIDLSPDYKVEIDRLLQSDDGRAIKFADSNTYIHYLVDTTLPKLPWENTDDLQLIKTEAISLSRTLSTEVKKEHDLEKLITQVDNASINTQIEELKKFNNRLKIEKLRDIKYDSVKLNEVVNNIPRLVSERTPTVTARPSLDLEWFVSLSLMVLNDAKDIIPSYVLGDDGIPTGFSSNIADIECLYDTFGLVVEVTLIMGRDQWYAEGQPVQRHIRDFEDKYSEYKENTYCLFIAPYLHRDTLNAYWVANKYGYEGRKQKIIPLRISQYVEILRYVNRQLEKNRKPMSKQYESLFSKLYENLNSFESVHDWIETFDDTISNWGNHINYEA